MTARTRNGDARWPSNGGVLDLVMREQVAARRYGGMAPRLGESGGYTAIRVLRANHLAALGGDGLHVLTALRCRRTSRGRVKGGRPIAAGECGSGRGRRKCNEQCGDKFGFQDRNPLKRVSERHVHQREARALADHAVMTFRPTSMFPCTAFEYGQI